MPPAPLDLIDSRPRDSRRCGATSPAAMDEESAEEYEAEFNRAVAQRLPRFALEIEDT